jgi:hypothetical protein
MKFSLTALGLTMAAFAAGAACSSSSSTAPSSGGNDGGGSANDSSAPNTGDATEPTDSGTTSIPPIQCGSLTCSAQTGGVLPLQPCCLPDNKCGATFGGAALSMFDASAFDASGFDAAGFDASALCFDTSAGTPDTSCPSQSAMGFALTGCCTAAGVCGLDLSAAGLGCNSLSALAMFAPADSSVGAPQACGAAADGGSDAATPETDASDGAPE